MIKSLRIFNEYNDYIDIPLGDTTTPYFVKSIDGLGPVKSDIITSDHTLLDGSYFELSKRVNRNIVINLGINPSYASSSDPYGKVRRELYPYLSTSRKVKLVFTSQYFNEVYIEGWVESFDPSIFTSEPSMTISVICPKPSFIGSIMVSASKTGAGSVIVNNPGNMECGVTILVDRYDHDPVNDNSYLDVFSVRTRRIDSLGNPSASWTYLTMKTGTAGPYESYYITTTDGNKNILKSNRATTNLLDPYATFYPSSGNNGIGNNYSSGTFFKLAPGNTEVNFQLWPVSSHQPPVSTIFFYPEYLGL